MMEGIGIMKKYMLYGSTYTGIELLKEYIEIIKGIDDSIIATIKRCIKDTIKM